MRHCCIISIAEGENKKNEIYIGTIVYLLAGIVDTTKEVRMLYFFIPTSVA